MIHGLCNWGYATQIKSICQLLIADVIDDFVFSVAAILNLNLDYAKNMVYCLGNGSILFFDHQNVGFASKIKCLCKLLAEISTILDFCGGYFEFCQYKKKAQ